MNLTVSSVYSPRWDQIIRHAIQLPSFALASRHLGYRSLFIERGHQAASVQVRDPLPRLGWWLSRTYVYPSEWDTGFFAETLELLKHRRLPYQPERGGDPPRHNG